MDERYALRFELTSGLPLAGRQWMRLIEHALGNFGISGSCALPLILIGRSRAGIHQVTLAEQAGVMGPSLVRLLDQLCAADLVRREEDSADRRAKTLWLTPKGRALAARLETRLTRLRAEVMGDLPASDLKAALRVHEALSRAAKNIDLDNAKTRRGRL